LIIYNKDKVAEYIYKVQPRKSDEMIVVFIDVINRPLHTSRMNPSISEDVRNVLKDGIESRLYKF